MDQTSKKSQTRARILAGAGRTFRSHGFDGVGVDGVAKAAGVTSGAFYAYFKSKADAFRETVQTGMQELASGIRTFREQAGDGWVPAFVDFYLGEKRTCALTESCALQSLTGEVARADGATRETFEVELESVIAAAAGGLEGTPKQRRQRALVMLALLSGGVSLARAVKEPALSQEIAAAMRVALAQNVPVTHKPSPKRRKSRAGRA